MTRRCLLILCVALVGVICAGCDAITLGPDPTMEPAFKGWELYSWQEGGAWRYCLLQGTNREKTWDEVMAAAASQGGSQAALEAQLSRLPKGEQVFWVSGQFPQTAFPDQAVVQRLAKICLDLGVAMHIAVVDS